MARHPHPGMKTVLASLFPDHPLVTESSSATENLLVEEEQEEELSLEETAVPLVLEPSPAEEKPLILKSSGLPRGKPGPKPKSMKQGRSSSPANPKISTFFSPKRSAGVLPSEEEEQVDEPSEPIVQKPRGPASRTGSTAASARSATTTTDKSATQSGMHPLFRNYIATAAAAPVPSGPPKVFPEKMHTCQVCKGKGQAGKER